MIELLPDLPSQVVGFIASGQVTAHDYASVVIPAIEARLEEHGEVRVLYQMGPAFSGFTAGAMWDDVDWIGGAMGVFGFVMPCPVKVFSNRQYAEAVEWIVA
jgi:hypothetical protein